MLSALCLYAKWWCSLPCAECSTSMLHVTAHPGKGHAVSNDCLKLLSLQNKPRAGSRTQISTQLLSLLHTYPFSSKLWSGHLETAAHLGLEHLKHMDLRFAWFCFVLTHVFDTLCLCVRLPTSQTTCKSKFPSNTQAPGIKVRLSASQPAPSPPQDLQKCSPEVCGFNGR